MLPDDEIQKLMKMHVCRLNAVEQIEILQTSRTTIFYQIIKPFEIHGL